MKVMRLLTATAVSAALAASMAMSASAATYKEVVEAAEDAGCQATNVQELSNFLEKNSSYFTSAQYDEMIAKIEEVSEEYVAPLAMELFGKEPSELTEDEKVTIGKAWTAEERDAIIADLQTLADEMGVEIDVASIDPSTGDFVHEVSATIKTSSGTSNTTVVTSPVAATGAEAESDVNTGVVACAGLALVVAVSGVVIVSRKNKA